MGDHTLEPAVDAVPVRALEVAAAEGLAQSRDPFLPAIAADRRRHVPQRPFHGPSRYGDARQETTGPVWSHAMALPAEPGGDDIQVAHPSGEIVEAVQPSSKPPPWAVGHDVAEEAQMGKRPAGGHPQIVNHVAADAAALDVGQVSRDTPQSPFEDPPCPTTKTRRT